MPSPGPNLRRPSPGPKPDVPSKKPDLSTSRAPASKRKVILLSDQEHQNAESVMTIGSKSSELFLSDPSEGGKATSSSRSRLQSPVRRSNLPVLAGSPNAKASSASKKNVNVSNSPRNSMYKETLIQQQNANRKSRSKDNSPASPKTRSRNAGKANSPDTRTASPKINNSKGSQRTTVSSKPVPPPKPSTPIRGSSSSSQSGLSTTLSGSRSRIPTTPTTTTTTTTSSTTSRSKSHQRNESPNNGSTLQRKAKTTQNASTSQLNKSANQSGGNKKSPTNSTVHMRNNRPLKTPSARSSRPVSRELETKIPTPSSTLSSGRSSSESKQVQQKRQARHDELLNPLPPKAKFRSDGEISICESATKVRATSTEKGKLTHNPNKTTGRKAKNLAKNSQTQGAKSAVKSPRLKTTRAEEVIKENQQSNNRLSSEVQCWPWTSNGDTGGGGVLKRASTLQRSHSFFKSRSRSSTLLQRLGSLRRSLSRSRQHPKSSEVEESRTPSRQTEQQDWVFFRGFSGKRREDLLDNSSTTSSVLSSYLALEPLLSVPLRRYRPPRNDALRRTLSMTDAHFISQAIMDGDQDLVRELYPGFPRGKPIYVEVQGHGHKDPKKVSNRQSHPSSRNFEKFLQTAWRNPDDDSELAGVDVAEGGNQTVLAPPAAAPSCTSNHRAAVSTTAAAAAVSSSSRGSFQSEQKQQQSRRSTPCGKTSSELVRSPEVSNNEVTFSTSVMFVKQASDLQQQKKRQLPQLLPNYWHPCSSSPGSATVVNLVESSKEATPENMNENSNTNSNTVISPWNTNQYRISAGARRPGSTSSSHSSSSGFGTDHQENGYESLPNWPLTQPSHPFAQRTQMHYAQRQRQRQHQHQRRIQPVILSSDVAITTSKHGGVTLSPSSLSASQELSLHPRVRDYEEDYHYYGYENDGKSIARVTVNGDKANVKKILAKADNSLNQAESILSSLRVENSAIPVAHNSKNTPSTDESEPGSLGSDIETNIRRLEKTQAKINAAIETFRSVQAMNNITWTSNQDFKSLQSFPSSTILDETKTPFGNNIDDVNTMGLRSKTAPAKLSQSDISKEVDVDEELRKNSSFKETPVRCGTRSRKTSLFRRHSFTSSKDANAKSQSSDLDHAKTNGECDNWYYGEEDSDFGHNGTRALYSYDDAYSFSDSEGGFLKHRLKGLFGSFGRGKKRPVKSKKKKEVLQGKPGASRESSVRVSESSETDHSTLMLQTTLGEFTRQIEILASKNASEEFENECIAKKNLASSVSSGSLGGQNSNGKRLFHSNSSHGPLRRSMSTNNSPDESYNGGAKGVIMRAKKDLCKNDSMSSCGTTENGLSNRNSVISMSSESFEGDHYHSGMSEEDQHRGQNSTNSTSSPRSTMANDSELTVDQRRERKVFYIAKEILTSERVYVDIIRLLNVEFREFVQKARKESKSGIMPDPDFSRLFSNLPELQALNEDLLQDFEDRIDNWETIKKIADVIVKKGPFLKLYTTYIREFSNVNDHFDECCNKYPKFAKIVAEFEKRDRCRNLKLKHFMLKPVQRLPQYKLLLEDYLKHLEPSGPDFDDTTNALRIVSDAADHANDTIKQGDQFRKMLKLQSRLGDTEFIRPGRELVKEGELQKISRKGIGPRYIVLLSDCLLICTYSGSNWTPVGDSSGSLRISYRIPLNALQVHLPNAADFHLEFNITSPIRSCTLRASTVNERNDWLEAINSAIEEHLSRKATFGHNVGGLNHSEVGKIGNSAPIWIPDRRVTMCQSCSVEFTVLVRRHHCRACGKVVCASCSGNKAPLRYRDFESARVCDYCYEFLEKELGHVKSLRSRFKRRDQSKTLNNRQVPQRLKLSANGEDAQMCGYLKRRPKSSAKWRRMWFVLKDKVIYAYKAPEDNVAIETFPILGYELHTLSSENKLNSLLDGEESDLIFVLTHPGGETLIFCTDNSNNLTRWISAIREAIQLETATL